ncbi:MAG: ATPase domain-containing protein [Candidatus Bathyarchaeia archaeon]
MSNYVPTGFPELDNYLRGGLVKPACIGLCGEQATSIYPFLFKLIQNFLGVGLRGIYVCLDCSIGDIKNYMKYLGIDIERYENDYSIFYLDLFTESQQALIEQGKIGILNYEPEETFTAIAKFFDWIKDGFLIIDSISTLTLNMDSKKAYELTRALKLLTRPFNLITISVMYPSSLDSAVFSSICSNADGKIVINKENLSINFLSGSVVSGEDFLIVRDPKGSISVRPSLPKEVSRDVILEIFNIFEKTNFISVNPMLTLDVPWSSADPQALISSMEKLKDAGVLRSKLHCLSIACPYCESYALIFHLKCPQCESLIFDKGKMIEHFNCGHIDFYNNFEHGEDLRCPKCQKKLRLVGVDYRNMPLMYRCSNGHIFSSPVIKLTCTKCQKPFNIDEARITYQNTYELTNYGREQFQRIKTKQSLP